MSPAVRGPQRPTTTDVVPDLFEHVELEETLRQVTSDVAAAAGFQLAAVSVFRNSEELEFLVVSGDEAAQEELRGDITPLSVVQQWLEESEVWGGLRFLPHERTVRLAEHVWVGDHEVRDHPDAWQPYDMLFAPLEDADGTLQGILWVDLPVDGLRPGQAERRSIEAYAARAAQAILVALERTRLVEQVRLARAARRVVRTASAQLSLDHLLQETVTAAREGFGVDDVRVLLDDGTPGDDLSRLAQTLAGRCWSHQRCAVISAQRTAPGLLEPGEHATLLAGLVEHGHASMLIAPLGAGAECLGRLLMFRRDREDWSDEEAEAALDIGHDLGRAVLNARSFEREQQAAAYKQQLIGTVAHELKNPLGAVTGYAAMLEDLLDAGEQPQPPGVDRSLRGINRAATRLTDIVSDLLHLSQAVDPGERSRMAPVDLGQLVREAVELLGAQAEARGISIEVSAPSGTAELIGDAAGLERLATNLVSNAVKYSHDEGRVVVDVRADAGSDGSVVLEVSDEGIGISPEDQRHLFEEFYRSSDPAAAARPGTGLGLAIAARVVERHRGRIEVDSEPGRGSTFRVVLPRR